MKSFVAALCLLLCLGLPTAQARGDDINGFQGMPWGSALTELQKTKKLVLTKENDGSGGSLYALLNESLRFGQATLTGIHCSFVQERLQGVILLFAGAKNYAAVKAEATARYGKPIKVDQSGGEMFTWPGEQTSIVLSYTNNAESGFLFLKPKELPAKSATAKAEQPKPPAAPPKNVPQAGVEDDLALFDQASQSQTITVEPAPGSSSLGNEPGYGDQGTYAPNQEAATLEVISPEIQGLIDRDQALTRLCWETVGPNADQACEAMKENARQLQERGWCMKPGEAKDGLQVIWYRCDTGQPATASSTLPDQPPPPLQPPIAENPRAAVCDLVVELFVAAAEMRDRGITPLAAEEALLQRQGGRARQLAIEHIRETVELVYFDQQYNALTSPALTGMVEDQCLSGQGPYIQPLPQD
ncbi:hypothetical protein [Desulfobulbus propionicus]|jgi:hypothetical protein